MPKAKMDVNTRRRERLNQIADARTESIYSERAATACQSGPVPRYAMVTTEGTMDSSYASNGDLTVYESLDDLSEAAAGQIEDDWTPKAMYDLDGDHFDPDGGNLGWRTQVVIEVPDCLSARNA